MGFQTQVKTRGVAPANAIVERITPTECVMRCVLLFDVNAPVEFEAHLPDRPPFAVRGTIRSRVPVPPRFEYTIALQPHEAPPPVPEALPEELGRKHQRYDAEFLLQYRTAKEGFRKAKGRNVSTGGLLMTTKEALVEGMFLELHFVLPSEVLAVYSFRKHADRKLREPFDDIVVQARVVHHRPLGSEQYAYGLNFVGLSRHDRDQIMRFVGAVSRVKLRQKP